MTLTKFETKVLKYLRDNGPDGGAWMLYRINPESKAKPQGAAWFIQGYCQRLKNKGLVRYADIDRWCTGFAITPKGRQALQST